MKPALINPCHKCPCCEMPIHHTTKYRMDMGFSSLFLSYDCGSHFPQELVFASADGKDVFEKLEPYQQSICIERQRTLIMKRLNRIRKLEKALIAERDLAEKKYILEKSVGDSISIASTRAWYLAYDKIATQVHEATPDWERARQMGGAR